MNADEWRQRRGRDWFDDAQSRHGGFQGVQGSDSRRSGNGQAPDPHGSVSYSEDPRTGAFTPNASSADSGGTGVPPQELPAPDHRGFARSLPLPVLDLLAEREPMGSGDLNGPHELAQFDRAVKAAHRFNVDLAEAPEAARRELRRRQRQRAMARADGGTRQSAPLGFSKGETVAVVIALAVLLWWGV